jgi:hypothetical protein
MDDRAYFLPVPVQFHKLSILGIFITDGEEVAVLEDGTER